MGWEKLPNGKQYTINIILVIYNKLHDLNIFHCDYYYTLS
jgi:hypothetical protein